VLGVLTVVLLAFFVYLTAREMKRSPPAMMPFFGEPPDQAEREARTWDARAAAVVGSSAIPAAAPDLVAPAARPLRILVATDGSPCSDRAVQSVAMRPWPAGSQVEVVSVVHTRMPSFPDPQLMIEAAYVEAREADRQRAPGRVQRAERCLAGKPGISVTTKLLEGNPAEVILDEAERLSADLLVVGAHGYGPVTRRLLGSVSQAVALHAHCSVEIVRCPHEGV
jgi:nucleotide-binding universal stress UspA family protein